MTGIIPDCGTAVATVFSLAMNFIFDFQLEHFHVWCIHAPPGKTPGCFAGYTFRDSGLEDH
jgi:hypothetical protein